MKKLLLLFALLLPLALNARPAGRNIPKAELSAIISEFRHCDGMEVVRIGRLGTAAIKALIRATASKDPEAREALDLVRGVRKLTVLQYDDCAPEVREQLGRRLSRALEGSDLLMEARDNGSSMRIYGVVDDVTGDVSNFVLHAPGECALIFIAGKVSADTLGKMLSDD